MLKTFIAPLTLGIAITFAAGFSRADDKNKCVIAVDGDNAVVQACKAGGIKRAKTTMKAMTKLAKEKGKKWECDTCHKNEQDWKLTDDGEKLFKELLELTKEAK